MLKHEETANVGDVIKAYDFRPGHPGCPDMFVLGVVKSKGWVTDRDYKAYVVECIYDSCDHEEDAHPGSSRKGKTVYIPFEVTFEYDQRVTKV